MDIEIRSGNEALVYGYVNAVERFSKPIRNMGKLFVEKVKAGVFGKEIARAKSENRAIKMLIDHEYEKEVASTKDGTLELREDSIGLYARAKIREPAIIAELRAKGAKGWSFAFLTKKDSFATVDGREERTLEDVIVEEVSLLINKSPAYVATSAEIRDGEETEGTELRGFDDVNIRDCEDKHQNDGETFDVGIFDGYKGRINMLKIM